MSTFNYPFDKLYGPGTTCSIDLVAGTTYTFDITNNTGSSYFVLETVRDYNGVTPKNLSGSLTNFSNIAYHVADDYKAGFVLPTSTNSFDFTPANNVVKETLMFRGTGGIILGTGSAPSPPTPPVTASLLIDTSLTSSGTSANNQFRLPLLSLGSPFTIDWGDGTIDTITTFNQPEVLHTYPSPGEYYISVVSGILNKWQFATSTDAIKLKEIFDWSVWEISNASTFVGCSNLVCSATNAPTITTSNLNGTFADCTNFNGPLNQWDVSGVIQMKQMFQNASSFNQPLDSWDVSGVTNMQLMFTGATSFDQNIGGWDIENVTDFLNFMNTKTPSTFSTTNLNAIYNGWSLLNVQPNLTISFGTANYTAAGATGRATLDNAPNNWTIVDGGQV